MEKNINATNMNYFIPENELKKIDNAIISTSKIIEMLQNEISSNAKIQIQLIMSRRQFGGEYDYDKKTYQECLNEMKQINDIHILIDGKPLWDISSPQLRTFKVEEFKAFMIWKWRRYHKKGSV